MEITGKISAKVIRKVRETKSVYLRDFTAFSILVSRYYKVLSRNFGLLAVKPPTRTDRGLTANMPHFTLLLTNSNLEYFSDSHGTVALMGILSLASGVLMAPILALWRKVCVVSRPVLLINGEIVISRILGIVLMLIGPRLGVRGHCIILWQYIPMSATKSRVWRN